MVGLQFELDNIENYDWMTLEEGEEIEYRTHPSIIPHLPELITTLVFAAAIVIGSLMYGGEIGQFLVQYFGEDSPVTKYWWVGSIIMLFLFIGDALWTYYQVKATFYVFTTDKFIRKFNIINTTTRETPYEKVQHFDMDYGSFIRRFLNIGTIAIATAGTGGTELRLKDVPNPTNATDILSNYT